MFRYVFVLFRECVCVCERQKSPTPKIRVVRHVTFDTLGTQNIRTAVVRIYFTFFFFFVIRVMILTPDRFVRSGIVLLCCSIEVLELVYA